MLVEPAKIIQEFYSAFSKGDYQTMQKLYHDEATFSDPVFQNLNAREARAMWEMLLTSAKDLEIKFSGIKANQDSGQCHWEAWYTFSKTGNKVHNIIDAKFLFKDGLILRHEDNFDLWRWSRQALGVSGVLLGWSPFVQSKVRKTARARLRKFVSKSSAAE